MVCLVRILFNMVRNLGLCWKDLGVGGIVVVVLMVSEGVGGFLESNVRRYEEG